MTIYNISRSTAVLYKSLLSELRPEWVVEITNEDYNLYKLGFVKDIPCTLDLDISESDICDLFEEIIDMETDVYIYEELLDQYPIGIEDEDKKEYKRFKQLEKVYKKFAPLEGIYYYWKTYEKEKVIYS